MARPTLDSTIELLFGVLFELLFGVLSREWSAGWRRRRPDGLR